MAKDRKKVLHIHSNVPGKQPSPSQLEIGEIAVNTAEGKEFLSIKNSNENNSKIVRFSSDEQMVDWMEKKEVFPYSGSIDSVDDVNNTSNLVLKFNQKAASGTPHSSDVNNGSGFTINMDKYAMIGANPSFSSVTADAINGKQFETELTDDSDAKVPTSKAVADYTNDAISSYTEDRFVLKSELEEDEFTISTSLNDLNGRVEMLENTQVEIPTSITDLDEYDSATTEFNFGGAKVKNIGYGYIESGLTVEGETILNDTLNIYADSNIIDDLTVSGDTTIGGELKIGSKNTSNIIKSEYDEDIHGEYLNIDGGEYIKLNNDTIVNDDIDIIGDTTIGGNILMSKTDEEEGASSSFTANASGIELSKNDGQTYNGTTIKGGFIKLEEDDLDHFSTLTPHSLKFEDDGVDNSTTVTMNGVTITDGENTVNVDARSISADTIVARNLQEKELAISASLNDLNDRVEGLENTQIEVPTSITDLDEYDSGATEFNFDNISIATSSDLTVLGESYLSGVTNIYDTLNAEMGASISNGLYVSFGGLSVSGDTTLKDALNVSGNTTLSTVDARSISADTIVARNLQEKELAISASLNDLNDRIDNIEVSVSFVQTSDIKAKKNIEDASYEKAVKANDLEIKQFNFIDDETNRTIYGVIAQEAEELGLNEIVYEDRKGYKAVNYNSLIMLKLAYLENENKVLRQDLIKLSERISKLEK